MTPRRRPTSNSTPDQGDSDGAGGSDYDARGARGAGTAPTAAGGGTSQQDIDLLVNKIVRLALFHEYKRQPLKRKDINALMAGKGSFARIFPLVQARLAGTFGMQLYELRGKYTEDPTDQINADMQATQAQETQAQTQRRKGKGRAQDEDEDDEDDEESEGEVRKQPARKKVKTGLFILRNTLPANILTAMTARHPLPVFPEDGNEGIANGRRGRDRDTDAPEDSGALIPWERADAGSSQEELGIRSVILTLILTAGRTASEEKLYGLLRRFGLQMDTILPFYPPDSHRRDGLPLSKFFGLLEKQGYLEKAKVPSTTLGEPTIEWRWGARADAEFGERAALAFLEDLCLDPDSSGDSETEGLPIMRDANREPRTAEQKRKHYENKRVRLRRDVEGAAGAPIVGEL